MNEAGAFAVNWGTILIGLLLILGLFLIGYFLRDDRSHGPIDTAHKTDTLRSKEPSRPMEPTGLLNPHKGTPARADGPAIVAGTAYHTQAGSGGLESTLEQPVGTGEVALLETPPPTPGTPRTDVREPAPPASTVFEYTAPSTRSEGGIQASDRPMGTPGGVDVAEAHPSHEYAPGDEPLSENVETEGGVEKPPPSPQTLAEGKAETGREGGYTEPRPTEPRLPGSDAAADDPKRTG